MILASEEQIGKYTKKGYWGHTTLNQILKDYASKKPDKDLFVDPPNKEALVGMKQKRISYKVADRIIDTIASNLIKMGIKKDDTVVIQLPNVVELGLSYMALWRIGAVASPVPLQWRSHELNYVIKLTEAKALITVEEFHGFNHLEAAKQLQKNHSHLKNIIPLSQFEGLCQGDIDAERIAENTPSANDIVTICYTSGTEADPKACPLSHNNWIFQGSMLSQASMLKEGCVTVMPAAVVNMTGIGVGLIFSLLNGGTLVFHHPFDPASYMEQLLQEKVNFGVAIPAMLVMILKYPGIDKFDLGAINSFVTGSAPPPAWALKEFKEKWDIEIVNLWGQNECTGIGSGPLDVSDLEVRAEHFPFWGSPGFKSSIKWTEGVETKIISVDTGEVLTKPGEVGELLYKGPNVIPCYFKQPKATQAAFEEDGFFHTGDLFQVKPDNLIRFFDRKKDIIIRGGQNISAAEVENIVKGHPSLLDAAAVDMPDERLNEKVCIYVVPKPGQNVTLSDITSFMKKEGVAIYKFPERLEIVDEIPRNPLGKALKGPLREDIRKKISSENS